MDPDRTATTDLHADAPAAPPDWLARETRRRVFLLYGISGIGIATLAVFGVVAMLQGNLPLGLCDGAAALLLAGNLAHAHRHKQYEKNIAVGLAATGVLFAYLFMTGGIKNTAFVWYYTFPLVALYLLGARKGAVATSLMLIPALAVYGLGDSVSWLTSYDPDMTLRFIPSLLVVTLFAFLFESTREKNHAQLIRAHELLESRVRERTRDLSTANRSLLAEAAEREEAQASLKDSHRTLVTILESIPADVYVSDMDSHEILFVNKSMGDRFGGDLVGRKCWEAFRQADAPCGHCTNHKLLDAQGRPTGVHVWEGHNPVVDRWYTNHDRAVRWVDGRMVRLQVATDSSLRRELEEQLQQARKMEAIGTLAGGIAHDFNNILGVIYGFTELTRLKLPDNPEAQENLQEVLTAATRAKDLVRQILTFSRKTAEKREPLPVAAVVEETMKLLWASIPRTVKIRQDIDPDAGAVLGDRTQLHQVVMNLCTNAYQTMRETGGELEVQVRSVHLTAPLDSELTDLAPGEYVLLTVRDTGPGISDAALPRIFEPYYTTKGVGEGTGMGLAVTHGIVKAHGGAITVDTRLGEGTTFQVYLPAHRAEETSHPTAVAEAPGGSGHVLCVDDEPALARVCERLLGSLGYRVTVATTPEAALELFRAAPAGFDLLLTDQTMPGLTGADLAKEVLKTRPDLPVIICTGYSDILDDEGARALGVRALAAKPLDRSRLAQAVSDALRVPEGA